MKTFIQAAGIFLIFVLTLLFVINIFGHTTSDTELNNSLDRALEHALYNVTSEKIYTVNDTEELAADVIYELVTSSNIDAEYSIKMGALNKEEGLIDVEVTQKVKGSKLINSEATCRRTVILAVSDEE